MSEIVYTRDSALTVDEYIDVVGHSALGAVRPLADRERVAAMIAGAGLIVTARLDSRCVGLARTLADFAWVAYCADIAVHEEFQGRGIGKGLMARTKQELGDGVGMALISVPGAVSFYEGIGLERQPDAFWSPRTRGI